MMDRHGTEMRCPLCGYRFSENELKCHTACPFGEGCRVACCPRCGYQIMRDTKTVLWLKKILGKS